MSNHEDHAEELFDALNKQKKKRKRRLIRTVCLVLAAVLAVGFFAVATLRRQVQQSFAAAAQEVLRYEVQTGTIHTLVSGSGTLEEVDLETLTVPAGVEIDQVLVEDNQVVAKGDVLATVDMSSVMTALTAIQEEIDQLDEELADAREDSVSSYVTAGISGRVKRIFAEKGSDVAACMAENGALAVLSLDGYMAVDIETQTLAAGDTVAVTLSDGDTVTGTVDTVSNSVATILVTDNGPGYDEEVTVQDEEGNSLGSGKLYIHNPLAVTGYAGTVRSVSVSENSKVGKGTTLFTLKDTDVSAGYDTLLRTRQEKEEVLLQLLTIYRDSAVLAPMDGLISTVEYGDEEDEETASSTDMAAAAAAAGMSSAAASTEEEDGDTDLVTMCPNVSVSVTIGVDETDILSLEVGQEAQVEVNSVQEDAFTGTVTEVSREANTDSGVTQYSAVVTLDKAEGMLAGMTAQVDVRIEGTQNALIIPLDALHQTSDSAYVYTGYDEENQQYTGRVEVTVGMQNDSYVEILSGLQAGDTVYYTEAQSNPFGFPMGGFSGMGGMEGMSGMGGFSGARGNAPGGGR